MKLAWILAGAMLASGAAMAQETGVPNTIVVDSGSIQLSNGAVINAGQSVAVTPGSVVNVNGSMRLVSSTTCAAPVSVTSGSFTVPGSIVCAPVATTGTYATPSMGTFAVGALILAGIAVGADNSMSNDQRSSP